MGRVSQGGQPLCDENHRCSPPQREDARQGRGEGAAAPPACSGRARAHSIRSEARSCCSKEEVELLPEGAGMGKRAPPAPAPTESLGSPSPGRRANGAEGEAPLALGRSEAKVSARLEEAAEEASGRGEGSGSAAVAMRFSRREVVLSRLRRACGWGGAGGARLPQGRRWGPPAKGTGPGATTGELGECEPGRTGRPQRGSQAWRRCHLRPSPLPGIDASADERSFFE